MSMSIGWVPAHIHSDDLLKLVFYAVLPALLRRYPDFPFIAMLSPTNYGVLSVKRKGVPFFQRVPSCLLEDATKEVKAKGKEPRMELVKHKAIEVVFSIEQEGEAYPQFEAYREEASPVHIFFVCAWLKRART